MGDYGLSCKAQSQKREKKLAKPRFSLFLSLQVCVYPLSRNTKRILLCFLLISKNVGATNVIFCPAERSEATTC
ncbi:MAG: hypothetical protein EAZ44_06250 [Cytophagia bacterium]|nr:MAG: hypothetical protein EAY69_12090 [Cytophagales bacterium]TAG03115.1 MAG: hypothetical protein EAZ44_06250 [Cytophagia bacterium]